jgi:ADP-ribosylglycohydrolase
VSADDRTQLADRSAGCLLGLACGDAFGGGWLYLAPGDSTDDTQLTLALAHNLACGGALDLADGTRLGMTSRSHRG